MPEEFGQREKLLFVCSRNKWRSLTAEKMYQNSGRYQVRSAGTDSGARIRVTPGHINWADTIFVMESKHATILRKKYADLLQNKKLTCLNIPDNFRFMDEELVDLLKARLSEHIQLPDE